MSKSNVVGEQTTTTKQKQSGSINNNDTAVPSDALMQLMAPDGYYMYLNIERPTTSATSNEATEHGGSNQMNNCSTQRSTIDEDLVKKNYRKLSLKHHPDRRGGDEETFRALNRAQRVLLSPRLRQQYDLLGIDLEDDDDDDDHHHHHDDDHHYDDTDDTSQQRGIDDDNKKKRDRDGSQRRHHHHSSQSPTPETIVSHMASAALAGVLQSVVRTAMMGFVSVVIVRYRITLLPAIILLGYIALRIQRSHQTQAQSQSQTTSTTTTTTTTTTRRTVEVLSPLVIAIGLLCMYFGRNTSTLPPDDTVVTTTNWTFLFWIGEAMVASMFAYNSIATHSPVVFGGIAVVALILTLWTRGDLWKYLTLMALQVVLAILLALLFPIMEMLLEAILNEKLRKVGEKIRNQNARMQAYYNAKQ